MIPHQPLDALGVRLCFRLDPLSPERHELVHVPAERFGMGIAEVIRDVAEQLGTQVWDGRGAFRREGEKVGLDRSARLL